MLVCGLLCQILSTTKQDALSGQCNRDTFKEEPGNSPRLLIIIKPWNIKDGWEQDIAGPEL